MAQLIIILRKKYSGEQIIENEIIHNSKMENC